MRPAGRSGWRVSAWERSCGARHNLLLPPARPLCRPPSHLEGRRNESKGAAELGGVKGADGLLCIRHRGNACVLEALRACGGGAAEQWRAAAEQAGTLAGPLTRRRPDCAAPHERARAPHLPACPRLVRCQTCRHFRWLRAGSRWRRALHQQRGLRPALHRERWRRGRRPAAALLPGEPCRPLAARQLPALLVGQGLRACGAPWPRTG